MWDHCENLLRFTAHRTFSFALSKISQKHETKGKGFRDAHIIEKAMPHFPVYFMQASVYTLRVWEVKKLLTSF